MNKLLTISLIISLLSCVSEIEGPDSSFVKIIGNDAPSQGFKLKKLNNGQMLILGQTSTSAFDLEVGIDQATFASSSLVSAPSISIVDESGNLVSRYIYPIQIPDFPFTITTEEIENRALFTNLVELEDGSFLAIGELSTVTVSEFPAAVNSPFYVTLDSDFNLQSVEFENTGSLLDSQARTRISVAQNNIGEFNMLFAQTTDPINTPEYGYYSMRHFQNDNLVWERSFNEPGVTQGIKIGWDHTFDTDGSIVVIGQDGPGALGGQVFIARHDRITGEEMSSSPISEVGELGIADRGTILTIDNGFAAFYMQYPDIFFSRISSTLTPQNRIQISKNNFGVSQGTFIREVIKLKDGGYAVLGEILKNRTDDQPGRGIIIRITEGGRFLWQYEFDGFGQDIMETEDEGLLILANPVFNRLSPKTTLIKLRKDGTL